MSQPPPPQLDPHARSPPPPTIMGAAATLSRSTVNDAAPAADAEAVASLPGGPAGTRPRTRTVTRSVLATAAAGGSPTAHHGPAAATEPAASAHDLAAAAVAAAPRVPGQVVIVPVPSDVPAHMHPKGKRMRNRTSAAERAYLEAIYAKVKKPDSTSRSKIAQKLSWPERSVRVWFQNMRQKDAMRLKAGFDLPPPGRDDDAHHVVFEAGAMLDDEPVIDLPFEDDPNTDAVLAEAEAAAEAVAAAEAAQAAASTVSEFVLTARSPTSSARSRRRRPRGEPLPTAATSPAIAGSSLRRGLPSRDPAVELSSR
ncbi:hypothetical protein AMAG_17821 [Allomyces macrogynus ATCC 38327]|uniref:Homeobox domain-containing protein n=1 Tax=Allomyces macrogynus (strain ATCC 38327) TaxID=578462 RepID=A0A0L0RZK4_ALLM3|nr:hypothetical protein AMAG_17821 [Allomyces macrogynus ATCC 38327]|eukprot:KNE55768.1 hypothetical protein AMAG_17821 [Allomyces macrogynus ATCC 38327]